MSGAQRPIVIVLGTRPEAVKLTPVIHGLRSLEVRTELISTGQHRKLLQDILDVFALVPDHALTVMRPGQTLDEIMASSLTGVGELIHMLQPAAVVVQGDTTSALAAALAAFHQHVPVAHVEAGLRSGRLDSPFPEEMNRRALSTISRWHFAPTVRAVENLRLENIRDGVHLVGNTVVDALIEINGHDRPLPDALSRFIDGRPYVVATAHRRESWGSPIRDVARGLRELLGRVSAYALVFVTHPNPQAQVPVRQELGSVDNALVIDALDYASFIRLLRGASLVITDSGGVQEEAPTLGVPVLVTREITERQEGIDAGAAILVGTDSARLVDVALRILEDASVHERMSRAGPGLYGDGVSGMRISQLLVEEVAL